MDELVFEVTQEADGGYVAECLNLAIVTRGKTMDETVQNLREAIQLHLEGENLVEMGLAGDLV